MTVAIVGGGFSGSIVAAGLLKASEAPIEILLLEKTGNFGAGLAYATDDPLHLLNVPAAKMSAVADDPDHFVNWLRQNKQIHDPFVPRGIYRSYIQDHLNEAASNPKNSDSRLSRIVDEAIALNGQFEIETKSGESLQADYLVLATGHLPETRFGSLPTQPIRGRVVLIGSGLTAIDAALSALAESPSTTVTAISPHGSLPETYACTQPHALSTQPKPLRQTLKQLRKDIEEVKDWQPVFDTMRPHWDQIWQGLTPREQHQFLAHLAWRFDKHRHRIPPAAASALQEFAEQGRFQVLRGTVQKLSPGKVVYSVDGEAKCLEADSVVDCTGRSVNWAKTNDPFIRDLFSKRYIEQGPHQMGIDRVADRIYAIGPMLKGVLWETTAVAELRVQAKNIYEALLADFLTSSSNALRSRRQD